MIRARAGTGAADVWTSPLPRRCTRTHADKISVGVSKRARKVLIRALVGTGVEGKDVREPFASAAATEEHDGLLHKTGRVAYPNMMHTQQCTLRG